MRVLVILSLLLSLSASLLGQNDYFELYGDIKGDFKGKVYLFYDDHYRHRDSIASKVTDGKVYFHEKIAGPVLGRLFVEGSHSTIADIYLEQGVIHMRCVVEKHPLDKGDTMNTISIAEVDGSAMEDERRKFHSFLNELDVNDSSREAKNQAYYQKLLGFVKQYPASKLGPYLVSDITLSNSVEHFSYRQVQALYDLFGKELKGTYEMKKVEALLTQLDKTGRTTPGARFYDVVFHDPGGNSLDSKRLRGKYALIVFWASWCGPCLDEMPGLNSLYERYGGPGFEMLGISLDTDAAKWKKAIAGNKMKWLQVADGKGNESEIARYYDLENSGIPFSLLLDKEGRIIGSGWSLARMEEWIRNKPVTR